VINEELKQLIDYHACRIFLLDPEDYLHPITWAGLPEQPVIRLKIGQGLAGWIALHGEAVIIPNTLEDNRVTQIAGTPVREESMIGAPLIYEGRVRGVITLSKLGTHQFDENSLRLLHIVAAQAAIAFDRARLYDELRTEAMTDPLTGLYNRRYLLERIKEERSRAIRNNHPLAAIMIDIDRFKQVNDRFGHDAGDIVLEELATLVRSVVRAEDIVARYGGEEFCILLPELPLEDAEQVAERLRRSVAEYPLPSGAGVRTITVSVGVAFLSREDEDAELFTRADHAMYQVKRAGRNGVCIADGEHFRFLGRGQSELFIGAVPPGPRTPGSSSGSVPA
jgi:diguanylate cyclase (GGDEF)-like protein